MQSISVNRASNIKLGSRGAKNNVRVASVMPAHHLMYQLAEVAANGKEFGSVNVDLSVPIGAAVVVTLIATAIIPLALKPGQEAADKMFQREGEFGPRDALTKKAAAKKK